MLHLHADMPPPRFVPTAPASDQLDAALLAAPVLIVEDEAMIAWTMESLLEDLGFTRISIAPSGEAAIEEARRLAPQLVVSDINLGPRRMDGVAAVIAILADAAPAVVFVTGYADEAAQARIRFHVPGAVVLAKPVGGGQLAQAINAAASPHR